MDTAWTLHGYCMDRSTAGTLHGHYRDTAGTVHGQCRDTAQTLHGHYRDCMDRSIAGPPTLQVQPHCRDSSTAGLQLQIQLGLCPWLV